MRTLKITYYTLIFVNQPDLLNICLINIVYMDFVKIEKYNSVLKYITHGLIYTSKRN